jgi:hypothetical protein
MWAAGAGAAAAAQLAGVCVSRQVDCWLVGSRKAGAGSIALRSVVQLPVAGLWAALIV